MVYVEALEVPSDTKISNRAGAAAYLALWGRNEGSRYGCTDVVVALMGAMDSNDRSPWH